MNRPDTVVIPRRSFASEAACAAARAFVRARITEANALPPPEAPRPDAA